MRRSLLLAAAGAGVLAVVIPATAASAHPLGNVTVNTYAGLVVAPERLTVDYVLDLAELPALQAIQQIDDDGDGAVGAAEGDAYQASQCRTLADGLELRVGERLVALDVPASLLNFPPGQAGLDTLRLECTFTAAVAVDRPTDVRFADGNLLDRTGWREVTAQGDGVTLGDTDVPAKSISAKLTAYPGTGAGSPRVLAAGLRALPGGPRLKGAAGPSASSQPQARGTDGLTQTLAGIVGGRHLGLSAGALALLIAVVLGGLHSLAPGHGKSLMAAAVVGRRGAAHQVVAIGATVAATHTAGVLVLGAALWTTQAIAPDRLLPWLTTASGALLVGAGLVLLAGRLQGRPRLHHGGHHHHNAHDHDHDHGHGHDHAEHGHHHDHHDHDHNDHDHHDHEHDQDHDHGDGAPSRRWLVTMGVAGGLVPTPSALVVLLGATALGRAWFGVVLVAAYGVGMALTLLGAGLLLVRFQARLERHLLGRTWWPVLLRFAPVVTAALLVGGGLLVATRGLAAT